MPVLCREKQISESFFEAVEEHDAAAIKRYLSDGIDVNGKRGYGAEYSTPLTVAVAAQNFNTVVHLITHGANLNLPGSVWGATPLHVAARYGRLDIVKLLVDSGADVNSADRGKATPLMVACEKGDLPLARYLLSEGASVNNRAGFEVVPAGERKCINANDDLTDQQREDLLDPFKGNTPLTKAAYSGNVGLVNELFIAGSDLKAKTHTGNTALHIAARNGHVDITRLLIGQCDSLEERNDRGETAVIVAVRKFFDSASGSVSHAAIIGELLQAGCDVAAKNHANESILLSVLKSNFKHFSKDSELLRLKLLQKILGASRRICANDLPAVSEVSCHFAETFGNPVPWLVAMSKSPWSLQHLCRLVIWERLPRSRSKCIRDLPITATMAEYLEMQ